MIRMDVIDPSPDACSAILCLNCGHYYCNYCLQGFAASSSSTSPATERAEAHEHVSLHKPVVSGEARDPFLPSHLVAEGQRAYQRGKVVRFLSLLATSSEYLESPTNGRQLASMVLVLCSADLLLLSLSPESIWVEVLQSIGDNASAFSLLPPPPPVSSSSPLAEATRSLALALVSENGEAARQILSLLSPEEIDVNYVHTVEADVEPMNGMVGDDQGTVGYPLVTLAVLMAMDDVAITLLERGADVLGRDNRLGRTAMFVIIERGGKRLVDFVFEHFPSFDWNTILTTESCQYRALHVAARYNRGQWIARLVSHGAELHAEEGEYQYDPLLTAVVLDNHWTAVELIRCGADPMRMSPRGKCAAAVAAERGHLHILAACLNRSPEMGDALVDPANSSRLLDIAIAFKRPHVVTSLIQRKVELSYLCREGQSPLLVAVLFDDEYSALQLIEAGADVHQPIYENRNALFIAIEKGFFHMVRAWLTRYPEDINKPCSFDQCLPPLAVSTLFHRLTISHLLLELGADVNVTNPVLKLTPLHLSILDGDMAAMQLFLRYSADLYFYNHDGKSALYFIMEKGLLDALHLFKRHVGEAGFDVNAEITNSGSGVRCLHVAAMHNHPHMVSILLSMGADIHLQTAEGQTALQLARYYQANEAETALLASMR